MFEDDNDDPTPGRAVTRLRIVLRLMVEHVLATPIPPTPRLVSIMDLATEVLDETAPPTFHNRT
jgi:hypothetical protein